jgi:N-acetylmuramoyl-L-alanine amidase
MRSLWQSFRVRRRDAVCGCVGAALCVGALASAPRVNADAWQNAVAARQAFEAEPSVEHTKAEYSAVMDNFRAIYHGNPGDAHAARAIEQVAELLAEQGQELHDRASLRDAAGQYEFLAKAYPGGRMASEALGHALELLAPNAADDHAEMLQVARDLRSQYPRSEAARKIAVEEQGVEPAVQQPVSAAVAVVTPYVAAPNDTAPEKRMVAEAVTVPDANRDAGRMADVTGIRHWSTPTYTRVAIDLGGAVEYQAARVEHPDRIYFDLHHTRLGHALKGKSFVVTDDGLLTRIRAAQFSNDVTRVVLDVHNVGEYSAFLLPNPYRLIIDIHGKPGYVGNPGYTQPAPESSDEVASVPLARSGGGVSGLPPMPVTDGSRSFGAAVPNTVSSNHGDSGFEVAAVSQQRGRVEATRRPTSQPIASGSKSYETADAAPEPTRRRTHVEGEPAVVAPPIADGETSLMRTLGLKIGRIVIDAGHGGHDSGTLGVGGIEEKDVVLDVALRLGELLHDRLGAQIVYTRDDDTFIPLETRTAIANKAQADLFISIHANSSQDPDVRGVEVYYLNFTSDPDAMKVAARENAVSTESVHELSDLVKKIALKDKIDESKELATDVDDSLYAGLEKGNPGMRNRGVKKAPFVVLIGANMPSILAEISFVTNPKSASELEKPAYRERVAESLYKGIARYATGINGSQTAGTIERAER